MNTTLATTVLPGTSTTLSVRQAEVMGHFLNGTSAVLSVKDADVARGALARLDLVAKANKVREYRLTPAGEAFIKAVLKENRKVIAAVAPKKAKAPVADAPKQAHTSHADCDHEVTSAARAKCRRARLNAVLDEAE